MSVVSGKVIISGEHAVVYGKMALVASISLGVRVTVEKSKINTKENKFLNDNKGLIARAVELAGGDKTLDINMESELPVGSGLGSSAAVCAAVIKGVRQYLGNPIEDDELFSLTFECEKIAHGNPSGIDPAAVVYRGLIAYTKGDPFERLKLKKPIDLLLIDSGKPTESTKEMVELVARNPGKDKIVEEIGELSKRVKEELARGRDISELLNENGLLLEELGVVGKSAKTLAKKLRGLGASVKIAGAGGIKSDSGMMIVMAPDFAKVKKLLDNNQIKYFETVIGGK